MYLVNVRRLDDDPDHPTAYPWRWEVLNSRGHPVSAGHCSGYGEARSMANAERVRLEEDAEVEACVVESNHGIA